MRAEDEVVSALAIMDAPTRPAPSRRSPPAAASLRYHADAVLWALALMHVTYVWRLPSLVPALQPLHLGMLSGVLALGLFLLDRSSRRHLHDLPMRPVWFAAGLLAFMVLSVPTGLNPGHSARFVIQNVIPRLLLVVMIGASMRCVADIEWFAWVNMLAAAGYCAYVLVMFPVDETGRLGDLVYYDTNDLGLLLVSTFPMVVYFLTRGQPRGRRLFAALCAPLFLLMLVETGSRGGFIGFVVVGAYVALSYRGFSRGKRLAVVATAIVAFALIGGARNFARIETIFNPTADYNWSGRSPTGRFEIWKRGLGYVADHPVLGVGANNFDRAEGTLSEIGQELQSRGRSFAWSVAHNSYLETAAEAGIVALVMFLGLFASVLQLLRRVIRATTPMSFLPRELVLAQTLTASLIGFLVCAFFISAEYFVYPYVLLGLSIGLAKTTLSRRRALTRVQ